MSKFNSKKFIIILGITLEILFVSGFCLGLYLLISSKIDSVEIASVIVFGFLSLYAPIMQLVYLKCGKTVCYISYDHKFFYRRKNIFEHSELKKSKQGITFLLSTPTACVVKDYSSEELNIFFRVYELEDNFQLLVFKQKSKKCPINLLYADYIANTKLLADKLDFNDFTDDKSLEYYCSKDKLNLFTIFEQEGKYFLNRYFYLIDCCSFKNLDFKKMVPHWIYDRDNPFASFDNIDDARNLILSEIKCLDECSYMFRYFTLPKDREGSAYHEFSKGNDRKENWNCSSILLHDDIMTDSKFYELLYRIVPCFDLCADSTVDKDTWELLKIEAQKESEIIQDIVKEMTPWAENAIELFGCFTIKGV